MVPTSKIGESSVFSPFIFSFPNVIKTRGKACTSSVGRKEMK
jgi:hypothetical protein